MKRVLLAEDNPSSASFLRMHLEKAGYYVITAYDGQRALEYWKKDDYDVVITDWMMPGVDGVEILRYIRSSNRKQPLIIIYTALNSESARKYSKECGANEFYAKPVDPKVIIEAIEKGNTEPGQPTHPSSEHKAVVPSTPAFKTTIVNEVRTTPVIHGQAVPPFVGICLAISTGGPVTLTEMLTKLPRLEHAAMFIVLHGPSWMMDSFAARLTNVTHHTVVLAEHGMKAEPGLIYLAAGDHHLLINNRFGIELNQEAKENYVRPAADPLFRTCASAFGKYCLGIVMTGLGSDGTKGAQEISKYKGKVIVQEPTSCVAPPMPSNVIKAGVPCESIHLDTIHVTIEQSYKRMWSDLQNNKSGISSKLQNS
ncbi:MAG: chemotaxis protein CheB [Candidatus Kapaibacterium sp.]|nr:chemotaxis protein CheB [Bacteroidota bacterium]